MNRLYLDANATYGILPEVVEFTSAMLSRYTYQNGSATHIEGQNVRALIDEVRSETIKAFGLSENNYDLVFNSGATEGNTTAINAALFSEPAGQGFMPEVLTSTIEHSSVSDTLDRLEKNGQIKLIKIKPDRKFTSGSDDNFISSVISKINSNTKLITIMWSNNESGRILPIARLFQEVKKLYPKIILHTDAVQAVGKINLNLASLPFDILTTSVHKFGGLAGSGIMLVSKSLSHQPLLLGGSQENRWRAGTENLLGIVAIKPILSLVGGNLAKSWFDSAFLRDSFETSLSKNLYEIGVNSFKFIDQEAPRLPNTSLLFIPHLRSDDLVVALDLLGVSCSSGAACSSGKQLGATIMRGLDYPEESAKQVLRFSFRSDFKSADLTALTDKVAEVIKRGYLAIDKEPATTGRAQL